MAPRMERFQLSKVVTVSSTDGPTVHPRRPDCPSWAARLPAWQAPTAHRSVGQGGRAVHRAVGGGKPGSRPTALRQRNCRARRLRLPRRQSDCPPGSRTAHAGSRTAHPGSRTAHPGSRTAHPGSWTAQAGSRTAHAGSRADASGSPTARASVATDGARLSTDETRLSTRQSEIRPRLPAWQAPTVHRGRPDCPRQRVRQSESAARLSVCQLDCPLTTLGRRDHLRAAGSY